MAVSETGVDNWSLTSASVNPPTNSVDGPSNRGGAALALTLEIAGATSATTPMVVSSKRRTSNLRFAAPAKDA